MPPIEPREASMYDLKGIVHQDSRFARPGLPRWSFWHLLFPHIRRQACLPLQSNYISNDQPDETVSCSWDNG